MDCDQYSTIILEAFLSHRRDWSVLITRLCGRYSSHDFLQFSFVFDLSYCYVSRSSHLLVFCRAFNSRCRESWKVKNTLIFQLTQKCSNQNSNWTKWSLRVKQNFECVAQHIRAEIGNRWVKVHWSYLRSNCQWTVEAIYEWVVNCKGEAQARWIKNRQNMTNEVLSTKLCSFDCKFSFGLILYVNGFVFTLGIGHEEI